MTKQEAIEILEETGFVAHSMTDVDTALDMAIEALKEGEWLEVDSFESEKHSVTDMRCSLCEKYASIVLPHGNKYVYDFCPNCGADMRASKKIEYERATEQLEHDIHYEPTYNQNDGSM